MLKSLIVFIAFLLFLIGLFFLRSRKTGGLSPESGMIIDALNSIGDEADPDFSGAKRKNVNQNIKEGLL